MSAADGYWAMGGYAAYVWPAYAVAVVALVLLLVTALRSLRQAERELARIEGARPSRRVRARADKPAGDLA